MLTGWEDEPLREFSSTIRKEQPKPHTSQAVVLTHSRRIPHFALAAENSRGPYREQWDRLRDRQPQSRASWNRQESWIPQNREDQSP
jgi:hypothetical protein